MDCKLNNKKGFTLPEVLVALGIVTVLLGLAMLAAVQYGGNLKQHEMDTNARQMFIAAQNRMTSAEATGELKKFEANNPDKLGELMTKRPSDMDETDVAGIDAGEYYYITYNPGDSDTLEESILKYMLPFGAINDSLRTKGSYIIEYNIKNAFIYSVFYTESENGLSYNNVIDLNAAGGRANTRDGGEIRSEYQIEGQKTVVGYYGGTSAVNIEGNTVAAPMIKIKNGDILTVEIIDTNYFQIPEGGTDTLLTKVNLSIKGSESAKERSIELLLNDDAIAPTKAPGQPAWWSVEKINMSIDGKNTACLKYTLKLDNISIPEGHFAYILPEMIPGEDITITAESTSKTSSLGNNREKAIVNSLFKHVSIDKNDPAREAAVAEVSCTRHLQNLDSKVSGLPIALDKNNSERPIKYLVKGVRQTGDIDWNEFKAACPSGDIRAYGTTGVPSILLADDSYYGINNKWILSYVGNNHFIKNVRMQPLNASDNAGIFKMVGETQRLAISDLNLENISITASGTGDSGALIGAISAKGSVSLSEIKINGLNFTVSGAGDIGGLIGQISCAADAPQTAIAEVLITGIDIVVATNAHIGGAIGNIAGASKVSIKGCATADFDMTVGSAGACGGIIGMVSGVAEVQVAESYSAGNTSEGIYSSIKYNLTSNIDAAGGIVGAIENPAADASFDNCYSTCSVSGIEAGGFVGSDNSGNTSYTDCYSTGLVKGSGFQGAFAGKMSGGMIQNVYLLAGINDDISDVGEGDYIGEEEGETIQAKTWSEMASEGSSNTETHPYDNALTGQYPFRSV
ncbi:MAG: type II secretion system protein, partial [Eubacteriales bacterium]|nr:type II secretion system protein [Eubacteriales bacterium]